MQEKLNKVFSIILQEEIYMVGAGRTDTGVHAREMWAHFDSSSDKVRELLYRFNSFLDADIAIHEILPVRENAHARFDATDRAYEYHITTAKDPFRTDLSWWLRQKPDVEKMNQAAALLLDYDTFTSFSKSGTQNKTDLCDVREARWVQDGNSLVFHIAADRFLRNMVRAIVGTLVETGLGKREVEDMARLIEAQDRKLAGESAPAHGLYLTRVTYPKEIFNGR